MLLGACLHKRKMRSIVNAVMQAAANMTVKVYPTIGSGHARGENTCQLVVRSAEVLQVLQHGQVREGTCKAKQQFEENSCTRAASALYAEKPEHAAWAHI